TPEGKWQPLNIIIQSVRLVLDESYSTKQNFATKPSRAPNSILPQHLQFPLIFLLSGLHH
ncbi:hypothetical protein, partial [Vibrio mediterranei]|uniref:hypothetical protein n=1 Tax=Vibrio mediterranei TaxID=689 RepID=UPI001C108F5D